MTEYSLNTGIAEAERTCDNLGFGGMIHHTTTPSVSKMSTTPYSGSSPLENEVNPSSDTQKGSLPAPAGNIARRTS